MGNKAFEAEAHMRVLADQINSMNEAEFGDRKGFALLVFEFGKPGVSNYVSNAVRPDIILALRELADRLERRYDKVIPAAISNKIH